MDTRSLYVDADSLPWRPSPDEGVSWKKLRFDPETGQSAVLLRFEAGAFCGAHRHPAGEEYWVLDGSLQDGGTTYGPGTYVCHPPGSAHLPRSEEGCLLFVVLPRPVEMTAD